MDEYTTALVLDYMDLAASLAQQVYRTAPHALEFDELRGIAYLGLVGAAQRWLPYCEKNNFDPARLEFYRPFVVRRVHGALIDAIRASDWATRVLRTRAKALQEAGQDRGVPHEELARRTGMTVAEVRATIRGMAQRPVSIEAEEIDLDARQDVESSAATNTLLNAADAAFAALPADQQVVIALHYHAGLQLQQIAKALSVPETRVGQLHAHGVLAIHSAMYTTARQQRDTHA